MNKGKIRLFEDEGRSIVSFNDIVKETPIAAEEALKAFLEKTGQVMSPIESPEDLAHIPDNYYEVVPPFEEGQIRRFARICIVKSDDGRRVVEFIDNRRARPERASQIAGEVVDWVG